MRPTSSELLEAVAAALEGQVAPAVQDKWAASTLRSAVQLVKHLAVRVADEHRIIDEDNADAAQVLTAIAPRLAGDPAVATLHAVVGRALQDGGDERLHDATRAAARNDAYQAAIELLVRNRDLVRTSAGAAVHDELRAYLRRRLSREQHLYFPSLTGPPF